MPFLRMSYTDETVHASNDSNVCVLKGGYFEEAKICRERELQLKEQIARPVGVATINEDMVPLVSAGDVEAVVSAWSGVPVEQMSTDEMKRLRQLQDSLKVCRDMLLLCLLHLSLPRPLH